MFTGSILALFSLILLSGCDRSPQTYYPLKAGMSLEYSFSGGPLLVARHEYIEKGVNKVNNFTKRNLKGQDVIPQKIETLFIFRHQTPKMITSYEFIMQDSSGIYSYAHQNDTDYEPTIYQNRRCILKYPIKIGTKWLTKADCTDGNEITLESLIESINDTITVPSGNFSNCIKIKSKGFKKIDQGLLLVTNYEWLAPNVGTVKSISNEQVTKKGETVFEGEIICSLSTFHNK